MAKKTSTRKKSKAEAPAVVEVSEQVEDVQVDDAEIIETSDEVAPAEIEQDLDEPTASEASPVQNVELPAEPRTKQTTGFIPLVLGGLLAGGIGYGLASFQLGQSNDDLATSMRSLEQKSENLQTSIENLPEPVDLAPIQTNVDELIASVDAANIETNKALESLSARIETIEKQPSGDGTLQEAAIAAYERDIEALREQLLTQHSNLEEMVAATASQLEATRDEANAIEANTVAAARAATARSAVARIQTAIESGSPFGAALVDLEAVTDAPIPEALRVVEEGSPTLAALTASFPDAAREALSIARDEGASGETAGGISAFLRNQFSVRSVEPQEGGSADAILSRAEAALREGRLNDAIAEVAALPEVSRTALSEWSIDAELRSAAVDAAAKLYTKFNEN